MPEPKKWYNITAKAEADSVDVFIYDTIGDYGWSDISARNLVRDLQQYKGKKLNVRINSLGGAVMDGNAIYNYLKGRGNVHVTVDGIAASISSVVMLAGDKVTIAKNGMLMIHNVSAVASGTSEQLRKAADDADKFNDGIVATYVEETGQDEKQIRAWMDDETWFTAEEALKYGFVDEIGEPAARMTNETYQSLSRFRNVPMALGGQPAATKPKEGKKNNMEKLLAALVAAGLIPSAKLDDGEAADLFKAQWQSHKESREGDRTKITNLESENKTLRRKQAEEFVNVAAKAGRIKDDAALKGRWIEAYLKDEEGTKSMLEAVETKSTPTASKGAKPVPETGNDDNESDLEKFTNQLKSETNTLKRAEILRQMREARGRKDLFADKK